MEDEPRRAILSPPEWVPIVKDYTTLAVGTIGFGIQFFVWATTPTHVYNQVLLGACGMLVARVDQSAPALARSLLGWVKGLKP